MSLFIKPTNGDGSRPIIDMQDVHKYYKTAIGDYHALNSIDLQINAGEFVSHDCHFVSLQKECKMSRETNVWISKPNSLRSFILLAS